MSEPEIQAMMAALEAAASGDESCVLVNERGEAVPSAAATMLLDQAGVDLDPAGGGQAGDARAWWMTAASSVGPLGARCVARDFPRPGWSTHLLRRAVERDDALHDHHAARAFHREQVHLGKARHDLRGIANNVLLSIEIASRRLGATAGSETILATLLQVKKHAVKFVDGISELGAPDAAHSREDVAKIDLRDVVSRAVRSRPAGVVAGVVDVAMPAAPIFVRSRSQQLRSGLIDALDSLNRRHGAAAVRVDVRDEGDSAVVELCCDTGPESCRDESTRVEMDLDTLVLADLVVRDGGAVIASAPAEGRESIRITLPKFESDGMGSATPANRA